MMKLETLSLTNNLILAPMQNITTGPYRRFCRHFFNIGLVYIPMIYTKRMVNSPKSIEKDLYKIEEERPIGVQLIGSEPDALKKSIDYLESYKYDTLDLNAGCPSRRAIKSMEGGYLMKDMDTLKKLSQIAVKYSSRPISLKIRTGFERPVNIEEIAEIINNSGLDFLIMHARTVKSNFTEGTLDLDTVKRLKERLTIPLVGNGDIINPISAKHFIDYTNVDGLMIGRESMGNPEIFNQIYGYLTEDIKIPFENNLNLMKRFLEIYEEIIEDYLNGISYPISPEEFKFIELKRNSIWLTKNIKNSTLIRSQLSKTKDLFQLKTVLENIFGN